MVKPPVAVRPLRSISNEPSLSRLIEQGPKYPSPLPELRSLSSAQVGVLVSIVPAGVTWMLSEGWPGRASAALRSRSLLGARTLAWGEASDVPVLGWNSAMTWPAVMPSALACPDDIAMAFRCEDEDEAAVRVRAARESGPAWLAGAAPGSIATAPAATAATAATPPATPPARQLRRRRCTPRPAKSRRAGAG